MRIGRFCVFALALMLTARSVHAQFRGPGGGGPGGFGGGFMPDPNRIFDFLSRGKPHFSINDMRPGSTRDAMTIYAKEKGLNSEQITKDQYLAFSEYLKAKTGGTGGPPSFGKGPPPSMPSAPGSPTAAPGAPAAAPSADFMAQMADSDFKRRDRNGDSKLSGDEMSDTLRSNLDQFDKNKDNMIDFEEYKAYFAFRMLNRDGDRGNSGPTPPGSAPSQPVNPVAILIMEDYDLKPVVLRAGKLPKEMPKWFSELDTDEDGQIAMHEWRKGGKSLDEFSEWDRNEDGFITPEEVLRKMNLAAGDTTPGQSQSLTKMSSSGSFGGSRFGGSGGSGERPSFGGSGERPSFGGSGNGERPSFGGFGKKKGSK